MEYLSAIKLNKGLPENTYLNSLAPVRYLMQNELTFDRPVTIFVGENGVGKSTLLEAIAVCCGFNPEEFSLFNGGYTFWPWRVFDSYKKRLQ